MQKYWSLYNKQEKLRIDDLRIDQVQTILLAIPTHAMADWYVCRDGELQWQSLLEIPEFYEATREPKGREKVTLEKDMRVKPKSEPRRPLFDETISDMVSSPITLEHQAVKERRSGRRFIRNVKLSVRYSGGVFECETYDFSISGFSTKNQLPDDVGKTFIAELRWDGSRVKVLCERVAPQQFKFLEVNDWDVIRNWIINW